MPTYQIEGISVDFPKTAYPCQLDYMAKNLQALKTSSNALLESPTGTGKTLSLLCSTLAWQKHTATKAVMAAGQHNMAATVKLEYSSGPSSSSSSSSSNSSSGAIKAVVVENGAAVKGTTATVIYASRTHTQLAQVVQELKSTSYKPKMTVLGSRDQLCIHEKFSKLRGGALVHACNNLSTQRSCCYKNALDKYSPDGIPPVQDIEDIKRLVGFQDKVCPYFFTREVSGNADLVLLPYNYLLDTSIRATLKVNWQNSVIIFDEAHNLERVASDAASFSLTSADIARVIEELQSVLRTLTTSGCSDDQDNDEDDSNNMDGTDGGGGGGNKKKLGGEKNKLIDLTGDSSRDRTPSLKGVTRLLEAVFKMETQLDEVTLELSSSKPIGRTPSAVLPGAWLCTMLEEVGLSHSMVTTTSSNFVHFHLHHAVLLTVDHSSLPTSIHCPLISSHLISSPLPLISSPPVFSPVLPQYRRTSSMCQLSHGRIGEHQCQQVRYYPLPTTLDFHSLLTSHNAITPRTTPLLLSALSIPHTITHRILTLHSHSHYSHPLSAVFLSRNPSLLHLQQH